MYREHFAQYCVAKRYAIVTICQQIWNWLAKYFKYINDNDEVAVRAIRQKLLINNFQTKFSLSNVEEHNDVGQQQR